MSTMAATLRQYLAEIGFAGRDAGRVAGLRVLRRRVPWFGYGKPVARFGLFARGASGPSISTGRFVTRTVSRSSNNSENTAIRERGKLWIDFAANSRATLDCSRLMAVPLAILSGGAAFGSQDEVFWLRS